MFLDPPNFIRRSAAERRRIKNDAVIFRAAADLAQNKFQRVIFKKSDGARGNPGKLGIFFRPRIALL